MDYRGLLSTCRSHVIAYRSHIITGVALASLGFFGGYHAGRRSEPDLALKRASPGAERMRVEVNKKAYFFKEAPRSPVYEPLGPEGQQQMRLLERKTAEVDQAADKVSEQSREFARKMDEFRRLREDISEKLWNADLR